jgi:hypothetical protein
LYAPFRNSCWNWEERDGRDVENVRGDEYFQQNSDWKRVREEATAKNTGIIERIT